LVVLSSRIGLSWQDAEKVRQRKWKVKVEVKAEKKSLLDA
jgi:hypothetical protein